MNIPNILTMVRFGLIGVFIFIFYNPYIPNNLQWSIFVFILAGITDVLDGYIARKYNLVTKWGKLMDPLADKLMLITVLISLYTRNYVPAIAIIIVLVKELLMIFGAAFLYKNKKVVVQSNFYGKAATAAFYVAIIALTFNLPYAGILLGAALFSTLLALFQYASRNFKHKKNN